MEANLSLLQVNQNLLCTLKGLQMEKNHKLYLLPSIIAIQGVL
jgi:hypothetical protein